MSHRLPRGIEWLLRFGVPSDQREPIAGDLEEDHAARMARHGTRRAALATWWQAARVTASFARERALHGRELPPITDEIRRKASTWDSLAQDVSFGVRLLRRQPGFTIVAMVVLAVGIGASTAIFSIVDAVLWRPLPFPRAERVMELDEQRPAESRWFGPVSPADYFDWRRDNRSFSALAAYQVAAPGQAYNLTGIGEPERVSSLVVSPALLAVLGIVPALGRDFRPEEEIDGHDRVALISDGLWRRRFGADPSIVGGTIALNGRPFDVIGVLPARFWWPSHPDVLVPLALNNHDRALRGAHFLSVIGRLRGDVTPAQAREDLQLIGVHLAQVYPEANAGHFPNLRPLREAFVGDVRRALLVLLGAVGCVMLIACANVATLLLARGISRQTELSVRRAVGATRARVVRQMLTEGFVVALAGGAAGLAVAAWGLAGFRRIVPAQFAGLPGIAGVGIDARVLIGAFALSVATGMMFGVFPALAASDDRVALSLSQETRGHSGGTRARRFRSALVVAELALSFVLLAGAALLVLSFNKLINVAPGFQPAQVMFARVTVPAARYGEHTRAVAFFDALYERLRGAPGIQRVGATTSLPFDGSDSRLDLTIEHRTAKSPFPVRAHARIVSTGYFQTMGIPLVRGRRFTERDTDTSSQVVIINESAVRRYWPGANPIGQRISLGATDEWREIVGVVGDIRHEGLNADPEPAAFLPQHQEFSSLGAGFERTLMLVVRSTADTASMTSLIRSSIAGIDPQIPIGVVRPMNDLIDDSLAPRRLNFLLVSAFALVALVLTAAGLYGVMAYMVAQRTREIGVRMALGASRHNVLALMFRQAGAMTAIGIVVGVTAALVITRSLQALLYDVSAVDPLVYVGAATILAAVALAAVAVPASRAMRVDPLTAIRSS